MYFIGRRNGRAKALGVLGCIALGILGVVTVQFTEAEVADAAPGQGPTSSVAPADLTTLEKLVSANPNAYGGLTYSYGEKSVVVHIVSSVGSPNPVRTMLASLNSNARRTDTASIPVYFDTVHHSLAELTETMSSVNANREFRSSISGILTRRGVDIAQNRVEVGVSHLTSSVIAAAQRIYGSKVHVTEVAPGVVASAGRTYDSAPFYGGDRLARSTTGCTNSWTVVTGAGTKYTLTAGHCFPVGSKIYNSASKKLMGSVYYRIFHNGGTEGELIGKNNYAPYVWGGPNGAATAKRVTGQNYVRGLGEAMCLDGSYTGENCHGKITGTNFCAVLREHDGTNPQEYCHLDEVTSTNGSKIVQGGDSGGPVFRNDGSGGVTAYGIITGGAADQKSAVYTELGPILNEFSLQLATAPYVTR